MIWPDASSAQNNIAAVSAKNSFHGSLNPRAQFREERTVEDVRSLLLRNSRLPENLGDDIEAQLGALRAGAVRFRDLDPMGHVNNSVYLTYFEVARTAYWQELHHDYRYDVLDFLVARAECDYVSAAMLRETIRAEVWLSRIGTSSFVLDYELFDEQSERLVARGRTVQVMIDTKSGRSRPIEPELRERMRSFAEHWGGAPEE